MNILFKNKMNSWRRLHSMIQLKFGILKRIIDTYISHYDFVHRTVQFVARLHNTQKNTWSQDPVMLQPTRRWFTLKISAANMEADIEEFVMLTKTRSHRKLKLMRRRMDHIKFNGTSTFDLKHGMNSGPEITIPITNYQIFCYTVFRVAMHSW